MLSVKLKIFLKEESIKLLMCVSVTILLLAILAIWRLVETNTFIFIQIIICTLILLLTLYSLRLTKFKSKFLKGNELLVISISFIIVTFLLLNIDRSRSFFLLKWVESVGNNGISLTELQKQKILSDTDITAIKQRIQEQDQSGFLFMHNERIYISREGKFLVFIFRNVASFENLKGYKNA